MQVADHRAACQIPASHHSDADKTTAGLTAFFSIASEWALDTEQQRVLLGSPGRSTFFKWKKQLRGQLSRDTLDRISYLLGIYKALHILFPAHSAQEWLRNPNQATLFGGQSPLDYMLGGSLIALADVRRYLDAARG